MADVKIEVRANGPNRVYGPIDVVDQDGNAYNVPEGRWVSLCRCGQSGKKPLLRRHPHALRIRSRVRGPVTPHPALFPKTTVLPSPCAEGSCIIVVAEAARQGPATRRL